MTHLYRIVYESCWTTAVDCVYTHARDQVQYTASFLFLFLLVLFLPCHVSAGDICTLQREITGAQPVTYLVTDPKGRFVATSHLNGEVRLWSADDGTELHTIHAHIGPATCLAASPDGRYVLSGGSDAVIRLWRVDTGRQVFAMRAHRGRVSSVAFSPDQTEIASGGVDGTVRIWRFSNGTQTRILRNHEQLVSSLAFSPDGRYLSSGGWGGRIVVQEASTGAVVKVLTVHTGRVYSVVWAPDSRTLVCGGYRRVTIWNADTWTLRDTIRSHQSAVSGLAFRADGKLLVTAGLDKIISVVSPRSGRTLESFAGHEGWVKGVSFLPGGNRLVSGCRNGSIRFWRITYGRKTALVPSSGNTGPSITIAARQSGISIPVTVERPECTGCDSSVFVDSLLNALKASLQQTGIFRSATESDEVVLYAISTALEHHDGMYTVSISLRNTRTGATVATRRRECSQCDAGAVIRGDIPALASELAGDIVKETLVDDQTFRQ